MPAGEAKTGRRRQDVDQIRGRALPRDDELDDVVEQAGNASNQHQPAGPALNYEERENRDGADQDLPDSGAGIDQLHGIDDRTPVQLLDEQRDREVEREHFVLDNHVGVDREEDQDDKSSWAEPAPGGGPGSARQDLGRSLLRFAERC